jgi:hypothetical protein
MNYEWMPQLMVLALLFIVLLTLVGVMIKLIPQPQSNKGEKTTKPTKTTPDDLLLCLDFMLAHNIIDTKEYNQLVVKAMPYL